MKLLRSFVLLAGVLAVPAFLGVGGVSAPPEKKADKRGAESLPPVAVGTSSERPNNETAVFVSGGADPGNYVFWHIEFRDPSACKAFKVAGVYPVVRFQKWADVLVGTDPQTGKAPAAVEAAITKAAGYRWHDVAAVTYVPPPRRVAPAEKTRQVAESVVRGGKDVPQTGKGVILAIIDTGIDFRHPDFIDYGEDGKPTSRILYFWDTFSLHYESGVGKAAPFAFPTNAPIGMLYSRDELTQNLRGGRARIPFSDTDGHGTSCASIAAGNGNAAGVEENQKQSRIGVAPEADIIAIRVGQNHSVDHSALLGAICEWLEQVGAKEKKPIVLSCSFGGQHGGRDGNHILERQIDARFGPEGENRWCRAICIAGGNEGQFRLHAAVKFGGENAKGILKWAGRGSTSIYFDTVDLEDVQMAAAGKEDFARNLPEITGKFIHGITGKVVIKAWLPASGETAIYSRSGKAGQADAYINGLPPKAEFDSSCAASGQISSPATATQAITVGSFDFNDAFPWLGKVLSLPITRKESLTKSIFTTMTVGALSNYSNPGPRRREEDRVVKPDIVAPGRYFTAAAALNVSGDRDTSGSYSYFDGTSAATPYTAGVVALMLQKNKNLTNAQIKELLARHATKIDRAGQPLDRKGWGNGKLDLKAVQTILKEVPEP